MKLSDKGPIQAPPNMPALLGIVAAEVQSWPGVIAATHWDLYDPDSVDGADFYLGEAEIGHLHFYGEAHVASDAEINKSFIQQGKAQPFRYRSDPNYQYWTQLTIAGQKKAQHAIDLFRANYERLRSLHHSHSNVAAGLDETS